ncbi:ferritin [Sulfuricella sp. T08]|uniref:Ferritin Dps family protein n=1 Tax=Sulfuricella denitrificans (strain DSM 22764 / NBRC 105220 / skB26) TaxID=1163617 RepID=S6AND1_SULDS|nr:MULTISPECIES: ferritin-like domain-containing protein [Sulfuricella]BAN36354.1 ferritin Dps family protein [Sulfuricella denitrificans skB26]GAO36686.1 ferritin [Sulfuricella sp. T08]
MKITKKKLLEELNKDLEWEYAAAVQYVQHASAITGAQYESIQKELIIHSQEEMMHAVMLSDQIDFLGGVPTVDVEKRETDSDSLAMLKQDLKGEDNAINRYKERIAQAEALKEYGLRRVLEDILIQEEEHKRDLLTVIKSK